MENSNHPTQPLSDGSSLSDTLSETGIGTFAINPNDNLELQQNLVKQKETELKSIQDQIESFNQMVKQLNSQRELAVKRLADMDVKIKEMTTLLETEKKQVDSKDHELKSKRTQLQTLKNEEDELKSEFESSKRDLDLTSENLSSVQHNNNQVNDRLSELRLFLNNANTTIEDIDKAISSKDTIRLGAICSQPLTPPSLSINTLMTNGNVKSVDNSLKFVGLDEAPSFDPFADEDPFAGDDPFKQDDANPVLPEDDPFNPSSNVAFSVSPMDPFAPQPTKSQIDGF